MLRCAPGIECYQLAGRGRTPRVDLYAGHLDYPDPRWDPDPVPLSQSHCRGRFSLEFSRLFFGQNDRGRHAIHGYVCDRQWQVSVVARGSADSDLAWFCAAIEGPEDASLWPGAYRLSLVCRLCEDKRTGPRLEYEFTVANRGDAPLPFGLGLHPYFSLPPEDVHLLVPVHRGQPPQIEVWELLDCIPTGRRLPLTGRHSQLFCDGSAAGQSYDDIYRLCHDTGWHLVVGDRVSRAGIVLRCSSSFRDLVVYTPAHRQAICFEPYTCVTNAIGMRDTVPDTGLQVIFPGEAWQGWITFTARPAA